jgi:hypothetical protein
MRLEETMDWRDELTLKYPGILLGTNWRNPEGPRIPVEIGVEDGWSSIVIKLVEDIHAVWVTLSPEEQHEIYVAQIKEKFGAMRFYMERSNDVIWELIQAAEHATALVCEFCGAPGEIRSGSWLKNRCEPCQTKHKIAKKAEWDAYQSNKAL